MNENLEKDAVAEQPQHEPEIIENDTNPVNETPPVHNELAPTTADAAPPETVDIETAIAEAEQRGYLRGLNERAEALMRRPSTGQSAKERPQQEVPADEVLILNTTRRSIWDI